MRQFGQLQGVGKGSSNGDCKEVEVVMAPHLVAMFVVAPVAAAVRLLLRHCKYAAGLVIEGAGMAHMDGKQ